MIVHLYGKCAYTDHIGDICRHHDLRLIEDNAQAHGCYFGNDAQVRLAMRPLTASIRARISAHWATAEL